MRSKIVILVSTSKCLKMKVAVVGATGMVGNVMLTVLREQNFPITELIPVASEKSVGQEISFGSQSFKGCWFRNCCCNET